MTKIDIISGFLGAGKTTLIKKLFKINEIKQEKVVLIENEFGEIGIDGGFLKDSGVQIKEINSGCICCSLVGDFSTSMKEVISKYSPNRIIIEPSGVGKLSDIVNAVAKVDADLTINILATVVDGPKCKAYMKNFGEFFNNQVETAGTIIVNKIDKMDEEKLEEVVQLLKEKNPKANIITTPINKLDDNKLLSLLEEKRHLQDELISEVISLHEKHNDLEEHESCCHHHDGDEDHECCHHHDEDEEHECCHHHHHGHDADEVFSSWGIETTKAISRESLNNFLTKLATDESLGTILRAKGIIKASDNEAWYYFDFVSGEFDIRLGSPDYTGRVCVIGSKLNKNAIEDLFKNRG